MKPFIAALLLALVSLLAPGVAASEALSSPPPAASSVLALPSKDRLPGVDLAQGISEITGAAISPLLGVSVIGAWRYYHTPESMRGSLPWFCHPGAWGTAFGILALCFFKDVLGAFLPALVKKPFDMAELFESKLSALVASAAFVPLIASQMSQHFASESQTAALAQGSSHLPLAMMGLDAHLLVAPFCVLAFLVVWMASHAINVLIAISPFSLVDTFLKLTKTALLAVIVVPYSIHPYLGLAVSSVIILAAALLAPTAFRLIVFGTLFATDTIVPSRARRRVTPAKAHAFAGPAAGLPSRTYGHIIRGPDGALHFSFRPWLVMPRRTILLPSGSLALSRGVYFPSLLHSPDASVSFTRIILFLPRYRTHEQALAQQFELTDIRDSALTKGFKAMKAWFSEVANLGKDRYPSTPRLENGQAQI